MGLCWKQKMYSRFSILFRLCGVADNFLSHVNRKSAAMLHGRSSYTSSSTSRQPGLCALPYFPPNPPPVQPPNFRVETPLVIAFRHIAALWSG
jgi:hypothetical protein